MIRLSLAITASGLVAACALQQKVTLTQPEAISPSADVAIQIVDLRDGAQKSTHIQGHPHCLRSYGDDFIAPSKVAYFRQVIESRAAPHARANLTIERFETLEYCDATAAEIVSAAIIGATGSGVSANPPPNGDVFILRIAGKVNGAPFDISKWFSYQDIKYFNFPSEKPEYRERLRQALQSAADDVLVAGAKASAAG